MSSIVIYSIMMILGTVVGFLIGWLISKKIENDKVMTSNQLAEKILSDANKEADGLRKEAELEIKEKWYKLKTDFENETQQKKNEILELERKAKENNYSIALKEQKLVDKEKELEQYSGRLEEFEKTLKIKNEKIEENLKMQNDRLEKISGMTTKEARQMLLSNLENEVKLEAAQLMKDIKDKAKRTAEKEAKEIIASAIQRCSVEQASDLTVSVVNLPNDEMKGRVIGREGRNIRAFEQATGIDVIIDDTPEAVILSGFDPVRREIARISLERLVNDGRIHPARIEDVVNKVTKEIEDEMNEAGEQVCFDLKIAGLHHELVKLLGKLKFRTSYGQNVLQHSKEAAILTGIMASELKLDETLARRAGLLHDIGKAIDYEMEGTHSQLGYDIAKKYGEKSVVLNAIASHHEDVPQTSIISVLVQAADAISGARPGARRETLETYVRRLEKLEEIADGFNGVEKAYAIQAGREIRVMVVNEEVNDAQAEELASEVAKKIEEELEYPGQIKVTVIRETRAVSYAK